MPKVTYPNQRIITVNRERASSDFLGIKNNNWMNASRVLGAHALRLYLYIASNADKYELALSPADIERSIGMPRSTYQDQFRKLVSFGYIVDKGHNHFEFYETPQTKTETDTGLNFIDETNIEHKSTDIGLNKTPDIIEININNPNSNINSLQKKQVSSAQDSSFIF